MHKGKALHIGHRLTGTLAPSRQPSTRWRRVAVSLALVVCLLAAAGCREINQRFNVVTPRALRDVPAARLAFRLEPDISAEALPANLQADDAEEPLATIKMQFESSRKDEALLRTVVSPDGQRALALYDPGGGGAPTNDTFRIDIYGADGMFVRNVLPADLAGVFPAAAAWSPDGQWIAFIGRRNGSASQQFTPSPLVDAPGDSFPAANDPNAAPTPTPTVAPLIATVPTFTTEQIYLCDRDGFNLRPLTARDGLIYFQLAWSPDGQALAALACKETELTARINEDKQLAGRPRVISRDGRERLLDDQLMDAFPVWSPDGAKIATAAGTDVAIYDASGDGTPTAARLPLREPLLTASAAYDQQHPASPPPSKVVNTGGKKSRPPAPAPTPATAPSGNNGGGEPLSFNSVVRLEWVQPELLLAQTGFIRVYQNNEQATRYLRWHLLHLSPQAVVVN